MLLNRSIYMLCLLAGVLSAGLVSIVPAAAQQSLAASEWKKVYTSRVRMIAGETDFPAQGWAYAGVQVQLSKGWKTYWRSPGDTGMPPSFDWSGSSNLDKAEVLFPAPNLYKDAYSVAIGYKSEVVLPVRISAKDPSKPVEVKLRFGYGLCEQICVPGEADLKLVLQPRQTGFTDLLSRYQQKVPVPVERLGQTANGYAIRQIDLQLDGPKPHIDIEAQLPPGSPAPQLFAEASNGYYMPQPTQLDVQTGLAHYRIDLTHADPPQQLKGQKLALTLAGKNGGIEYRHPVK
jgi:DsbC/DsbD-like thiol-disulfide interchange protein